MMTAGSARRLATIIACSLAIPFCVSAQAQGFQVCKSTFALCTIAPCDPIPGNSKEVACHCTVNYDYSASQEPCQGIKDTPEGQQIRSRYYPVKSYAICSNARPWAWCLDKPCTIDKNNPGAATCTCDKVENLGDYVIVTDRKTPATCTTGIISSATVQGITEITDFLDKAEVWPPYSIKVLK
jgi:hypothetical protein